MCITWLELIASGYEGHKLLEQITRGNLTSQNVVAEAKVHDPKS